MKERQQKEAEVSIDDLDGAAIHDGVEYVAGCMNDNIREFIMLMQQATPETRADVMEILKS